MPEQLDLTLDAAWAFGLVLSLVRVGAFVVASPFLARVVPVPARMAVTVAIGLFLADPVPPSATSAELVGMTAANVVVGVALGYLTGLIIHLFPVAGGVIDMASGLAAAGIFDPSQGTQAASFQRLFNLGGLALFYVGGGLTLLVRGLALSVAAIPLDGGIAPSPGLAGEATRLTGLLLLAGAELAIPTLAALFIVELVLGFASRFAPQANVFLIGLPAKLFVALLMSAVSALLWPEAIDGVMRIVEESFTAGLRGLRA